MDYKIDFGVGNFGVNTLNGYGIKALIDLCGGEQAIIEQISNAQHNGLLDRRRADSCKNRIRNIQSFVYNGKYKRIKICGVGLIPVDFIEKRGCLPRTYISWRQMLTRCYNPSERVAKYYIGCDVYNEWLDYSVFKLWYDSQVGCDSQYELDKDLLGSGKLYSPENCCLLPHSLNSMIVNRTHKERELPTGVYKNGKKFITRVCTGTHDIKNTILGTYNTPEEAHDAYCRFRENHIRETAQSYYDKGELDERAYRKLMEFKVI